MYTQFYRVPNINLVGLIISASMFTKVLPTFPNGFIYFSTGTRKTFFFTRNKSCTSMCNGIYHTIIINWEIFFTKFNFNSQF